LAVSTASPIVRFSVGVLLSDTQRNEAISAYIKHLHSKKDLIFGLDFDENLLAFVIEEGLVGKLAISKLAPILCDFVLIGIDRTSSTGSSPDLLNLPLIVTPRVLAAYEKIHSSWKKRRFDSYLHFAFACAQLLEVKHLPWLSHLILGYRRTPAAKSSIEQAMKLLGPVCDEVLVYCEQLETHPLGEPTAEDDDEEIKATIQRCLKFVAAGQKLSLSF
jgi:hypothetical protein